MIKVQSNIKELNKKFCDAPAEDIVGYFLQAFKGRIALSSSLSIEDQTLTDIIVKTNKSARDPKEHAGSRMRAIKPGEDIRAGRWWWESPEHRECGLHQRSKG